VLTMMAGAALFAAEACNGENRGRRLRATDGTASVPHAAGAAVAARVPGGAGAPVAAAHDGPRPDAVLDVGRRAARGVGIGTPDLGRLAGPPGGGVWSYAPRQMTPMDQPAR
jgi:hypothetical protein